MCGITGALTHRPIDRAQEEAVRHMVSLMSRRGPDDEGTYTDGKHVSLGFRRLSILDLSPSGHQPMLTEDGRYAIVFNGEVYNFQELRRELEGKGIRFRSTGDAEVVLQSLATWGVDALDRFNGMFALAFYDSAERTLLLARDHAGIKPLYYLHRPEGLVFASQYNQIVAHPWARSLAVSPSGLSQYLRFGYIPPPHALLQDTYQVPAGGWLRLRAGGVLEEGRHWRFPPFREPTLGGADAVEAFSAALSRSVKRQLVSDVPVGVFLSGGIDSPLVAAETARQSGRRVKAFTIGVDDPALDERSDACKYAEELDLEHIIRTVDPKTAVSLLDDVVEASSEPAADFSIFPTLLVSRLAREHVKVVLSGDGGDELFWGYPTRFGAVMRQRRYFRWPRAGRYAAVAARRFLGWGAATREVLQPTIGRLYQKKHTLLGEYLEKCFPTLPPISDEADLFDYEGTSPDETAQWLRWNEFQLHLAFVLLKVDRASMHNSLEVRVPLLDREVIEVALRTEWSACLDLKSGRGKIPLRQALRRRLRHESAAKKGFTVPMGSWLAGPLQPLLQEHVLQRREFLGLEVNRRELAEMNRALLAGSSTVARGLWLLLSLSLWQARHFQPS